MVRKVIITCAVTASEIAEAAIGAAEAGAAIVHPHTRNPVDGRPDQSSELFEPFLKVIRQRSDVQSVFRILGGIGIHPEDAAHMRRTADRRFGADCLGSVPGAGRAQLPVLTMAAAMGGNVRAGLEDSLWGGPGGLAKNNAEQVTRVRGILERLGLESGNAKGGAGNARAQGRRQGEFLMTGKSVLIVTAHPEPASFNHALAAHGATTLRAAGHRVVLSDLYAEGFNPLGGRGDFTSTANPDFFHYQNEQAEATRERAFAPDIAREQARVEAADVVVLQFPLWWGGPPAVLKGWLERVLAYGFGYVDGHRFDTGLFRGRRAMLSVTTGGTPARFSPEGVYGPIEQVLWPVQRLALQYMGFEVTAPFVSYGVPRVTAEARAELLDGFAARLLAVATLPVDRSLRPADPLALVEEGAWSKA